MRPGSDVPSAEILSPGSPRCPLCESPGTWSGRAGRRDLFQCRQCDLIFVPACQHLSPDAVKKRYDFHQNSESNAGYVAMFERFLGLATAFCPNLTRVLDYGAGPASVLADLLAKAGYQTTVYDPLFVPQTDLSGPFDLIVSTETFEHFARPAEELGRITSLLRPGGSLAVMTLFHDGTESLRDWWYLRDPTHVAFYSRKTCGFVAARFDMAISYIDTRNVVIFRRSAGD